MRKRELVTKLVNKINDRNLTSELASKVVNEVFNIISDALEKGDCYKHDHFGTFKVVLKSKRTARDINANKLIDLPERFAPQWTASDKLKDRVSKYNQR